MSAFQIIVVALLTVIAACELVQALTITSAHFATKRLWRWWR